MNEKILASSMIALALLTGNVMAAGGNPRSQESSHGQSRGAPRAYSNGPGSESTTTTRAGYLGGRSLESDAPVEPASGAATFSAPGAAGCTNVVVSGFARDNVSRYRQSAAMLGSSSEDPDSQDYLLANLQGELAKSAPDPVLAGSYIGLIAGNSVTKQTVLEISRVLCVPVSEHQAEGIAAAAEAQRRSMHR